MWKWLRRGGGVQPAARASVTSEPPEPPVVANEKPTGQAVSAPAESTPAVSVPGVSPPAVSAPAASAPAASAPAASAGDASTADAAAADQRKPASTGRMLRGVPEIRAFFRTNTSPVYFFGPTAFNLLGIDRWVRNFDYVVYYDSWDGSHPRVFTPRNKPYVAFESSEEINNYLLRDAEVQEWIGRRARAAGDARPKVAMVFFDEETEQISRASAMT